MGKGKIFHFGFNSGVQLFQAQLVQFGRKSLGVDNHLRNIAIKEGLASLSSPMVGQTWKALIILKKQYLKANKWNGYSRLGQASFNSYLNPQIIDQSAESVEEWEQCCGYPGLRLLIPRARKVLVNYKEQIKSQQKKRQLIDFQGRVFLHEMDHIQCIDPLKQAKQLQICQDQLRDKYNTKIQQLFGQVLLKRQSDSKQNIYHRSQQFNELRRQIAYTITDHYRKITK